MEDPMPRPAGIPRPRRADSLRAEAQFRARIAELGGTLTEPAYINYRTPHRALCAKGHECSPSPNTLALGWGLCRTCSGRDPGAAETAFRQRLADLGATLLEPTYLGSKVRHRATCVNGHACTPLPKDVTRGGGICRECAGGKQRPPEERFQDLITELGGSVLEPVWINVDAPTRVRCPQGHEATPTPSNVFAGMGMCRTCAGKSWDVFYVVQDPEAELVKVGVTSGDPRPRLRYHERNGFHDVVRLHAALPDGIAPELERTVLAALRDAREEPARGREYFSVRVLGLVLDLVDNHPGVRALTD